MLTPIKAFAEAAKLNPDFAKLAAAVVAALAVVAIATGWWQDDPWTPIIGVGMVFVAAVLSTFIVTMSQGLKGPAVEVTLTWFARAIGFLFVVMVGTAVSYACFGVPSTFPCTIRFGAAGCSQYVADPGDPPAVPAPAVTAPQTGAVERGNYTVYVQFAGFTREEINAVRQGLAGKGWTVPGAERIGGAARLNEIRYRSDGDKTAAAVLADEIAGAGLKKPEIRQVGIIAERTLKVWTGVDVAR